MTLGERLRELREERGIGLRELSRRSALSLSHLQYVERDAKWPGDATLGKLAPHLGIPVEDLVSLREKTRVETKLALLLREELDSLTAEQRARLLELATELLVPSPRGGTPRRVQ